MLLSGLRCSREHLLDTVLDYGGGTRYGISPQADSSHRYGGVLLRSAQPIAARHQGKHQWRCGLVLAQEF